MGDDIDSLENNKTSLSNDTSNNLRHNKNVDLVKQRLCEESNVNDLIEERFTPIYLASFEGEMSLVRLLLDKGAEVNVPSTCGGTPLHAASEMGYLDVVQTLLENGAEVNQSKQGGITPLYIACVNKHFAIVKLLLEIGAIADTKTIVPGFRKPFVTPLYIVSKEGLTELVKLMLDKGVQVDRPIKIVNGETPLHIACMKGHYDIVQLLLDSGADVNRKAVLCKDVNPSHNIRYPQTMFTPLMLALQEGHSRIVRLLIKRGAKVNVESKPDEASPLWICCKEGDYDLAKVMLEYGANPNEYCKSVEDLQIEMSPLYVAACEGHGHIVSLLLEYGAIIKNSRYSYREGPNLYMKVYLDGQYDMLLDLIRKKENSNEWFCDFKSLFEVAYKEGHYDIVDACIERCIHTRCYRNRDHYLDVDQHMKKLNALGLFNDVLPADQEILDRYNREIENMKAFKVFQSKALYVVIERHHDPYYLRNQDLLESLERYLNSAEAEEQFPLFGKILKNRFQSSKYRLSLLTKTETVLEGQEWWDSLPLIVKRNILVHLDNSDLENMCSSSIKTNCYKSLHQDKQGQSQERALGVRTPPLTVKELYFGMKSGYVCD